METQKSSGITLKPPFFNLTSQCLTLKPPFSTLKQSCSLWNYHFSWSIPEKPLETIIFHHGSGGGWGLGLPLVLHFGRFQPTNPSEKWWSELVSWDGYSIPKCFWKVIQNSMVSVSTKQIFRISSIYIYPVYPYMYFLVKFTSYSQW